MNADAAYYRGLQSVSRAIRESPTTVSAPADVESGGAGRNVGGGSGGGGGFRSPHPAIISTTPDATRLPRSARRRIDLVAEAMVAISRSVAPRASTG